MANFEPSMSELIGRAMGRAEKTTRILANLQKAKEEHSQKCYRVEWIIDVYADDPEGAARVARLYQLNPETLATVFEVYEPDGDGRPTQIDLIDIDNSGVRI